MRYFLLNIIFAFPVILYGQMPFSSDTVRIKEVIVRTNLLSSSSGGYRYTTVDTSLLKGFPHSNLSEIISITTPVFIKSYGPGGVASISFRGAGAGHTQLTWNEINVNSPMLGQSDLSLIPAAFADEIKIYSGGASMFVSTGGLGGSINFENKPEWKLQNCLSADLGAGSFGNYSLAARSRTGSDKFQSVTRAMIQSAENDFRFLNSTASSPSYEKRKNAESQRKAFMQELYFRKKRSVTSARLWYQKADRNLPSGILMAGGQGESQSDEFMRTMVDHSMYNGQSSLDFTFALISDRLSYLNRNASIDSRNHSVSLTAKVAGESLIGNKTRLKIVLNHELNSITSVNYSNSKTRNLSTVTASLRRVFGDNIGAVVLVRQMADNGKLLIPDFSLALDFRLFKERENNLKLNFSRNSKVPSMNDLYWNPGGNPDLKNEYSYSNEISWDIKGKISEHIEIKADIAVYSNKIRDMIQWRPGQFSYWSPVNISSVNAQGTEAAVNLGYTVNSFTVKLYAQHAFTSSHIVNSAEGSDTEGKQLIYVPMNHFNSGLRVAYRGLYASWISCYTGKRFITADNTQYLPSFILNNLSAGVILKSGKNSFDFSLKADNVFGMNYQAIAYYPMPGRSFLFSVTYQLFN
jgi:vitamin B12 transporter